MEDTGGYQGDQSYLATRISALDVDALQHRLNASGNHFRLIPSEQAQLRQDIAYHRQAIQKLSSFVNADVWINKLPEELIIKIFHCYIDMWMHDIDKNPRGYTMERNQKLPGYHGWLRIAHVCHHWRDVMLRHPNFWADIKLCRLEAVESFLQRSGQVPLTVYTPGFYNDLTRTTDVMRRRVFQESHRIENLHIENTHDLSRSREYKCSGFPILKQLILSLGDGDAYTLPKYLIENGPPSRLESLQVTLCSFDSLRPLFNPNIRHLVVSGVSHPHVARPAEWRSFLQVLEAMPQLEVLALQYCLPPASLVNGAVPDFGKTITLPKLRNFELRAHAVACAAFIRAVSYPAAAATIFHMTATADPHHGAEFGWDPIINAANNDIDSPHDGDLPGIVAALAAKMQGRGLIGDVKPIVSLVVDSQGGSGLGGACLRMSTEDVPWKTPPIITFTKQPKSSVEFYFWGYSPKGILNSVCSALPLQNVQRLFVDSLIHRMLGFYQPVREDWMAAFRQCTMIEELHAHACIANGLPSLLAPSPPPPTGADTEMTNDAAAVLFPHLSQIQILTPSPHEVPQLPQEWVDSLRQALLARRAAGAGLKKLRFLGPEGTFQGIDALAECVDEYEWETDIRKVLDAEKLGWIIDIHNHHPEELGVNVDFEMNGDMFLEAVHAGVIM